MRKILFLAIALSTVFLPRTIFAIEFVVIESFESYLDGESIDGKSNDYGVWSIITGSHTVEDVNVRGVNSLSKGFGQVKFYTEDSLRNIVGTTSVKFYYDERDTSVSSGCINGTVGIIFESFSDNIWLDANCSGSSGDYNIGSDNHGFNEILLNVSNSATCASLNSGSEYCVGTSPSYIDSIEFSGGGTAYVDDISLEVFDSVSTTTSSLNYPEFISYSPSEGETLVYSSDGSYDPSVTVFLPDNGRDWYIRHVDTYQEATTSESYPTGTLFYRVSGAYAGDQEVTWTYESSYRPQGLYSSVYELLQYIDEIGTTTVSRSNEFNWSFGTSTSANGEFVPVSYYFPTFSSTSTGCVWWYGMDVARCASSLIVPPEAEVKKMYKTYRDNLSHIFPFNIPLLVFGVLTGQQATGTLPSLAFTVPAGFPAAGATLDLTPWEYISGPNSYLSTPNSEGNSFWSVVMPPLKILLWTGFAFWVFFRLLGGGLFGEASSMVHEVQDFNMDQERARNKSRDRLTRIWYRDNVGGKWWVKKK